MLDFQRLDVYQLSRRLRLELVEIASEVRRGHAEELDQIRRASLSIKLNLAEGSGDWTPKEKARFYRMARRSADECGALLDDLVDQKLIPRERGAFAQELLVRIVSALVRLVQSTDVAAMKTARLSNAAPPPRPPRPPLRRTTPPTE